MTPRRSIPRIPGGRRALAPIAVGILVVGLLGNLVAEVVAHHANVVIFTLPPHTLKPAPVGITTGPDGNLWFTESRGNAIGRITPSGAVTVFALPDPGNLPVGNEPTDIITGPDGNLWFIEWGTGQLGRMTPSGSLTQYPIPPVERPAPYSGLAGGIPLGLAAGADGALWFGLDFDFGDAVGRMTTAGEATIFFVSSDTYNIQQITAGPDGNLWFTEYASDKIGRITPSGTITEFALPHKSSKPMGITSGADGNLWFAEHDGNRIGRITPDGTITEFPLPTFANWPDQIARGPDGNVWFTEALSDKIGRITPDGSIFEYWLFSFRPLEMHGISGGPDGRVWFTETFPDTIGRLSP
jgi:streptogramin lyase